MRRSALVGGVVLLALPRVAGADCPMTFPSIVNRQYAIDLYSGVPLGSGTLDSMGGAGVANAMGSSGTLLNPSAPAVRPTTDLDWWSLDVHLDWLIGSSTDSWNDGCLASNGAGTIDATAGIAGRLMEWAIAATLTVQTAKFENNAFTAQALNWKIAVARWIPRIDVAVGVAANIVQFQVLEQTMTRPIFDISGVGIEVGAQWIPRRRDFRVGVAVTSPIAGGHPSASCDPNACPLGGTTYILPGQVYVPWRVTLGAAYRFGPTKWNQLLLGTFRDERALTLVADIVATGFAPNAYGIEAFTHDQLERSGRTLSWSVRGGAELELLPGRLRIRGGSYYEPARFDYAGASGRVHATFGLDLRLFELYVWGYRRGRIGVTGDLAERYDNFSLSIGFWH